MAGLIIRVSFLLTTSSLPRQNFDHINPYLRSDSLSARKERRNQTGWKVYYVKNSHCISALRHITDALLCVVITCMQ